MAVLETEDWDMEDENKKSTAPEPCAMEPWEGKKVKYGYTGEDLLRSMEDFSVALPWIVIRKNDAYLPVLFKEKKCILETPVSVCLFGLETYQNPDRHIKKYSINFSVKTEGNKEMEQFVLAINQLDKFVQQYQVLEKEKFQPSIQIQRRNKSPTMRIKIPSFKKQLNIAIEPPDPIVDEIKFPSIDEFNAYVRFDTRVNLILMVNNIWRAAGKYGISYKLTRVKVHEDPTDIQFRH
jgi:hypothetical protein